MAAAPDKKHIVVLGGGFAGLQFVDRFHHRDARITLVDQNNHHLFQPLLYQVATAGLSMPDVSEPLRSVFARRPDVTTIMAKVQSIDLAGKKVVIDDAALEFDYLVIALGAVTGYVGKPEWGKHAQGLKSLRDAMVIRRRVLMAFEAAENETDPSRREELTTIAIVGGGPTGVELAGAFAELTRSVFRRDFRRLDPQQSRILLIHSRDKVLNDFPDPLPEKALGYLERLGVDVRLNSRVSSIENETVRFGEETVRAHTILWTAGVVANPVVQALDVPKGRGGKLEVEEDCRLPGHPEVFAVGDIAQLVDANGREVPGLAPAAMQMGRHVAELIEEELEAGTGPGAVRRAFTYVDKGMMATIGRKAAVAAFGPMRLDGIVAWFLWLLVHLLFLIGFRNKVFVLMSWIYAYSRYRGGARIIVDIGRKGDDF